MKKKYEKLDMKIYQFEPGVSFLAGSVQTIEKDFTVKTDDYELEGDTWSSNTITFD